jgi:hypothetical protein
MARPRTIQKVRGLHLHSQVSDSEVIFSMNCYFARHTSWAEAQGQSCYGTAAGTLGPTDERAAEAGSHGETTIKDSRLRIRPCRSELQR